MVDVHVTPLSLGIAAVGGEMLVVVPRNTRLPALKESCILTTSLDDQDSVHIQVLKGERLLVQDNIPLGDFVLTGIPRQRAEVPKIKVCFEVEVDGSLNASAYVVHGAAREEISIANAFAAGRVMSREEIDRMIADAEMFRREDEERKEKNVARYELECGVVNMRNRAAKALIEGSLDASVEDRLLSCIARVEGWLQRNHDNALLTVADLRGKLDELELRCRHFFEPEGMRFTHESEESNN